MRAIKNSCFKYNLLERYKNKSRLKQMRQRQNLLKLSSLKKQCWQLYCVVILRLPICKTPWFGLFVTSLSFIKSCWHIYLLSLAKWLLINMTEHLLCECWGTIWSSAVNLISNVSEKDNQRYKIIFYLLTLNWMYLLNLNVTETLRLSDRDDFISNNLCIINNLQCEGVK